MRRLALCGALLALSTALPAEAFCGFYVGKADSKLFNESSQVAIARHGDRTVLTMANDYQGDPREFAMVIPVPTFITREQIHVAEPSLLAHLDAFTAPRMVEYFDENPCQVYKKMRAMAEDALSMQSPSASEAGRREAEKLGVAIEASYAVGEYDILILSAEQSDGLETWLKRNGYRIPDGASRVLSSYIKQKNRFFVAKVSLERMDAEGVARLRPLQIAFESPKFGLPIRLGTVNANGKQDLIVWTLTRKGRVETTNYRTVKIPTDVEIPVYVQQEFPEFYRAMFTRQVERERGRAVFLEYAWNMGWCDPCAADPLSADELRQLGVFWLDEGGRRGGGAQEVFVTRLHVRYDGETFPEDLRFQETSDNRNFQGRYVTRHAWEGGGTCRQADVYRQSLPDRWKREARELQRLTGWDFVAIRERMRENGQWTDAVATSDDPWWRRLWPSP